MTCNLFFPLIQSLFKIGLSISASFYYQLEPVATLHICPTPRTCGPALKTCADLYQNFPASHIDIFAWYQIRFLKWCKWGWFVSIFMCLFVLLDCLVTFDIFWWCVHTIKHMHVSIFHNTINTQVAFCESFYEPTDATIEACHCVIMIAQ